MGIDFLVNYNPNGMTESEKFVQRFIDRLIWGTITGKVEWDYESRTLLCSETADEVKNPLVYVTKNYSMEADVWYDTHCYRSGIYSDSGVEVIDTCYHAAIPSDTIHIYNDIYLNAVRYHLPNNKLDDKANFVIEVYLRTKDTVVNPICSTFYVKDEIKQSVTTLYETVSSTPSHIGLETKTRHAMKTFMDLMSLECQAPTCDSERDYRKPGTSGCGL